MRTTAARHEDDDDAPIAPRSVFVGRVFGEKYRLDEEIGSGGMGVVLRGVHVVTGRAIAVKVLRTERSTESITKRFLREARVAATLDHPNAVGVLDCGKTHDGHVYQVLELLEGETLRDRLARGPMSIERTLALVLPVLHALEAAHGNGVIHRDLKPGNVFLAKNKHGRVVPKLLDFGIAKLFEPLRSAASSGEALTPTTQSGTIIGTPAYMSPEQARGEVVTKASDLFSMGAVLFECLTGEVPFDGVNPNVVMARIVLERARRVDEVTPSIPPGLAAAVDCALSPLPADRPPSAAAFASLLREAAKEAGIALSPEGSSDCADEDPDTATTLVHTSRRRDARPRPSTSTSAHTHSAKRDARVSRASTGLIVGSVGLLVAVVVIALVWSSAHEAQRAPLDPEDEDVGVVEDALDEDSEDSVEPDEASDTDETSAVDETAVSQGAIDDDVVEGALEEPEAALTPATDRPLPRTTPRATDAVRDAVPPIEPPVARTEPPPTSPEGLPEIREW